MSLRWRIALAMGAIAAFVAAFASSVSYVTSTRQMVSTIDDSLTARAAEANRDAERLASERDRRANNDPYQCPPAGLFQPASAAQIVSAGGTVSVCIDGGPALTLDADERALLGSTGRSILRTVNIDGQKYRLLTTSRSSDSVLQIARSLAEVDEVRRSIRWRLFALSALGVLTASALGWVVARRIARPIGSLRDTAETIARTQDLATPISVSGKGEIASLATSFAAMVSALATSREQQRRLITDASHEMRTPLTSLRTNLDMLGVIERLDPLDRAELIDAVRTDATELSDLFAELVELASDPNASNERRERFSLADVAHEVATRAARRAKREITVHAGDNVEVWASPAQIDRALANLVDNAIKYSPEGAPVEITVEGTRVEVRDHGTGIGEADLPFVFDRFFRAAVARTAPGSGLGLAIVKQIVERSGGSVYARNHAEGGAVVGFALAPTGPAHLPGA